MRMSFFLAIAGAGLLPSVAFATDSANFTLKTTQDLYAVCSTADTDPLRAQAINFCEGYLLGVVTYDDAVADGRHLHRLICYPPTATRNEGIQAFVDWAAAHQQDQDVMNAPPIVGAIRGLASKWPCNQEPGQ
jgi:Rap1a immunity proteins